MTVKVRRWARYIQRIWDHVDVKGENECWPWQGTLESHGHAHINVFRNEDAKSTNMPVRKVIFEHEHDVALPRQTKIIPICGDYLCCNPAHMLSPYFQRRQYLDYKNAKRLARAEEAQETSQILKVNDVKPVAAAAPAEDKLTPEERTKVIQALKLLIECL